MSVSAPVLKSTAHNSPSSGSSEMARLRHLLLGKDYQELLALKQQLNDRGQHSEKVAEVVTEALALRAGRDNSLSRILSPTVENALTESVERDPKRLANALYPVMGPAIRKSINEVLSQTVENFNQLLEQSLSPQSLLWRFDAWRTGRSYSEVMLLNSLEYHVEQVFLIHRESGLLLRHVVSSKVVTKDPDMISGMLTAIQDFISDSFEVRENEALRTLKLGELNVLVDQGPYAVIAAVVRGNAPSSLATMLKETQENIHLQMANTLQNYQGDNEAFVRVHPLLEKCLVLQTQQQADKKKDEKKRPWVLYAALAALLLGITYWLYQSYQSQQREQLLLQQQQYWEQTVAQINDEPGVVVIESAYNDGKPQIRGLRDVLARDPQHFIAGNQSVDYQWDPYLSTEAPIVLKRAQQLLQPPSGVTVAFNNDVLQVSGVAGKAWADRVMTAFSGVPGITSIDTSRLQVMNEKKPVADQVRQVESMSHFFESGDATIVDLWPELKQQAHNIDQLITQAQASDYMIRIVLQGTTDGAGSQDINEQLSRMRTENVRAGLMQLGIPGEILLMAGEGLVEANERSVSYQVMLEKNHAQQRIIK